MSRRDDSIILVGMPGVGKSTVGVLLAKELAKNFVDTDLLIQLAAGRSLQQILDQEGYLALRDWEQKILLGINPGNQIIATGGSAVYSEAGMLHLKSLGRVVFLDLPAVDLLARLTNFEQRGIAKRPEQSFDDLYLERNRLYKNYADMSIDCEGKNAAQIVENIIYSEGKQYAEIDA